MTEQQGIVTSLTVLAQTGASNFPSLSEPELCRPMLLRDKFVCCHCLVRWPCLRSQLVILANAR